jgi:hypothetical protein
MKKLLPGVLGLVATLAIVGCGERGPSTAKVTGKVTLRDGKALPGGRVDFRSATSGNMVSGQIKADGTYEAVEVPLGDYKVSVENSHLRGGSPPPPGLAAMPGSDQKYVPINPRYSRPDTSGLATTVGGSTHTFDVQLR